MKRTRFYILLSVVAIYLIAPFLYSQCSLEYQKTIYSVLHHQYVYIFGISVVAVALVFFWYGSSIKNNSKTVLFKVLSAVPLLFLLLILYLVAYYFVLNNYSGIGGDIYHVALQRTGDRWRRGELNSIQLAMELYRDESGKYPKRSLDLSPKFISDDTLKDPVTGSFYEYGVSSDGMSYVVKAVLGIPHPGCYNQTIMLTRSKEIFDSWLISDIDGTQYGIDCSDPSYCVGNIKTSEN